MRFWPIPIYLLSFAGSLQANFTRNTAQMWLYACLLSCQDPMQIGIDARATRLQSLAPSLGMFGDSAWMRHSWTAYSSWPGLKTSPVHQMFLSSGKGVLFRSFFAAVSVIACLWLCCKKLVEVCCTCNKRVSCWEVLFLFNVFNFQLVYTTPIR